MMRSSAALRVMPAFMTSQASDAATIGAANDVPLQNAQPA